ncbi:TonB-dependent receptor [Caenimonas aquaedulcis]|uniref:TonB-dependent receptor n=1 Tax=Caenimonas aquaedulcis TaxID=2793270 RepID=A0A931H2F3_9BURK|nr:TonB-dependent receptor [Caenimonas aquaedulcis]MBG9387310.1 TonB-dependent receptor [Caenimonas aquaedulcis]
MLAASVGSWAQEASTLKPVIVKDKYDRAEQTYQSGVTSTAKTPAAAKDVPQSLTVVNEKLIHDQGKDTFKEALQNVPGITFEAGEGGRIGDSIRLRGFSVSGDIYLDGIRDIAQYNRDTFNYDRIEVLRGSASMLFGRGSTGGVVNQVSRTPRLLTEHEVNVTVGDGKYLRTTGDFNFRMGEDSALRIGTMTTDWDGRADKASTQRRGLAADYRIGIGTTNEFLFSLYHLNYNDKPDLGGRWLEGRPAPFPADKWYGADSDYQKDSADIATLTWTHRWTDGSTLKTTLRDGHFKRDLWATQITAFPTGTTQANFGPSTIVNRGTQTRAGQEHHTFLQSDFLTKTQWFGRKNELLVGADLARERSDRDAYTGIALRPATTVALASNSPLPDTRVRNLATSFDSTALGVYVQDTITIAPHWKLVGGLRWDRFSGDFDRSGNAAPNNTPLSRSDGVLSKRAGILYQPTEEVSYYASYGTSFNTSGDLYQYDANSAKTPPESSRNLEVGAKWELYEGDLSVRTALARTDKFNERNTDVNQATGEYLLSGRRHTNSLEFEVAGRINPKWDVFTGLVFMHGVIDQAGSSPASQATVGLNPGLTPRRQANLWTTYKLTDKWRIGGGFTHVSENGPASANALLLANRAPAYTRWDSMLEYVYNENHTFKLNIDNMTNKVYYSSLYQQWPSQAPLRTVRATWTGKF